MATAILKAAREERRANSEDINGYNTRFNSSLRSGEVMDKALLWLSMNMGLTEEQMNCIERYKLSQSQLEMLSRPERDGPLIGIIEGMDNQSLLGGFDKIKNSAVFSSDDAREYVICAAHWLKRAREMHIYNLHGRSLPKEQLDEELENGVYKENSLQQKCLGFYILAKHALGQDVEYNDSNEIRQEIHGTSWALKPLAEAFEPFLCMSGGEFSAAVKSRTGYFGYSLYSLGINAMKVMPEGISWALNHITPLHPTQNHRFSCLCLLAAGNNYKDKLMENYQGKIKDNERKDISEEELIEINNKINNYLFTLANSDTSRFHRGLYNATSYFLKNGN